MISALRTALASRIVVSDGAMGTMLQGHDLTLDDFDQLEGCNEILNVTRPDVVRAIHDAYFAVGTDCVGTNTFGANLSALGEYDIADRIAELAEAGARIARASADAHSTADRPRWVLGSVGPGTKLPTLGHIGFEQILAGYRTQVEAMIAGGIDAVLIETAQDLLQAKAAVLAAKDAIAASGRDLPVIVNVTVETTGTMLLGSEIGAALAALEPLGIDLIGLNCATGPTEMSEHLRHLSRHARIGVACMPNAGLPQLTADGAYYPLTPEQLADAHDQFTAEFGVGLVGGCCGTTPEHLARVVERVAGRALPERRPEHVAAASSLYAEVPFRQDTAYLSIGERTNANGSKAFRTAMLEDRWDDCVDIARAQVRDGAHLLDLNVDYVGRDGPADMRALASRLATACTLPIVIDSTEPAVLEAGLSSLAGRCVVNSVNYEDGDGPDSRFARIAALVRRYGAAVVALTIDEEGQARTREWKVRVAERLIDDLTTNWGIAQSDIIIDALTFPIATGQEETRRDGIETIEAIREIKRRWPEVQTTLGLSNISFGLNPAGRIVLNSVFLHECVEAGLDSAIVHAAKIVPMNRIPDDQRRVALDMVYDRRRPATGDEPAYDPLQTFLELFAGVTAADSRAERAAELAALPVGERLQRRIIDGEAKGLEADLDLALADKPGLEIINTDLLAGMKVVGELFGSGEMQLPFVLQSAEVMKTAVAYLEPHLEKTDSAGKGTIVLATVKGDVHDIGKNLVDIILTNNGYTVVNLGIKQPIGTIIDAAVEHKADAIGMSGLLVKSTVVMKENLQELNDRGIAADFPVFLGGAALTRAYVEQDLREIFAGEVRYARDAFEGLRLMDALMAVKRGEEGASLPAPRERRVRARPRVGQEDAEAAELAGPGPDAEPTERSDVAPDVDVPTPPFWGDRIVKGIALAEVADYLDERATFMGQWGLKGTRGGTSYEELVETEGRPRLRSWLDRIQREAIAEFAVVYAYWPAYSSGNTVFVLDPARPDVGDPTAVRCSFTFPRQRRGRRLCLADFFRSVEQAKEKGPDVIAFHLVTMGARVSEVTGELFAANAYRDYLELHGLSVQLTEALAELWHDRIRTELGFAGDNGAMDAMIRDQAYRGSRYSFGYPACPDLEDRAKLVELLRPGRIGVELSEELQLHPEQSTDAMIVHHPEAKYFNAR
ncbi:5-methyltetrahydrofolate--homocysteine methyltransferase [Friedmanniella endophytica]|uniref:Methionine synthase n=1 Tax=Microlunatus kandeliicorticis TaxID=1759536 RepID=A0A7W3ITP5_9ACTN|nr:methionine synthase [Microlunatus kandeliicorticis]MBA8795069.1 5-methyltetrahydrofolate--homocysteine methyltransferase [Microlunatus kandeliicorticis]